MDLQWSWCQAAASVAVSSINGYEVKEKRKKNNPSAEPFDIALVYHVKLSIINPSFVLLLLLFVFFLLIPLHPFFSCSSLILLKTIFPLSSPTHITQRFYNNNINIRKMRKNECSEIKRKKYEPRENSG
jgi:hypothetical protein